MDIDSREFSEKIVSLYGQGNVDLHKDYSIQILSKSAYRENDIFIINLRHNDNTQRLGWLIPALSIISVDHDYYRNPHYEHYVQVANSFLSQCTPSMILNDSSHFFILKKEYLERCESQADGFFASLAMRGYYQGCHGLTYKNEFCVPLSPGSITVKKSIPLHTCTKYIIDLMSEYLPTISDPLSRFLKLYQVFEILMERHFHRRIDSYRNKKTTIGTIREKISDLSSERKLMRTLFDEHGIRLLLSYDEKDLIRRLYGGDREESYFTDLQAPDFIYDIRNTIVHSYHKYELAGSMKEISDRLEQIVLEVIEAECASELLNR